MAVTINDIKKLREMTGAGIVDCKKALIESENDMEKAVELIRQRGQAIAAKREDRNAAEGVAFAKSAGKVAAVLALKCETDFVASNEQFGILAHTILDKALENKVASLEELQNFTYDGHTVAEHITELSGITGEKMELGDYFLLEGEGIAIYNHFNKKLATVVAFNSEVDPEVGKSIAMQVASMAPIAATREEIPQATIDEEYKVAVEKTKQEQIDRAVNNALSKAGINPNLVDSEDHIESNIRKGWLTEEDAAKAREIREKTTAEKAANLPEQMIQNIANGRINKFYQDYVLMEQVFEAGENKETVAEYLSKAQKGLSVTAFKRVNLNAD